MTAIDANVPLCQLGLVELDEHQDIDGCLTLDLPETEDPHGNRLAARTIVVSGRSFGGPTAHLPADNAAAAIRMLVAATSPDSRFLFQAAMPGVLPPEPTRDVLVRLVHRLRGAAARARIDMTLTVDAPLGLAGEDAWRLVAHCDIERVEFARDLAIVLGGHALGLAGSELSKARIATHREAGGVAYLRTDNRMRPTAWAGPGSRPGCCPVRAVRDWIALAGLRDDHFLFPFIFKGVVDPERRTQVQSLARTVQRLAGREEEGTFGSDSLRRGYAVSALRAGDDPLKVAIRVGVQYGTVMAWAKDYGIVLLSDAPGRALGES